ncbi:ankyrin repeat ph and sec7 domain containing protein secg-related [Anaeramoeba flamelloides]|uniref:Ankyrin repeat ph and sec7 domain containing protein secg-related n=1 Tax=Anaeramoeba flamelloides TaxID=1746091 RepID=A0AAV7ZWI4_9EUKA|nr:ankyrin repeat ph and sec7 domain containing protein secg-related [Anaeramoeba flamelloides]
MKKTNNVQTVLSTKLSRRLQNFQLDQVKRYITKKNINTINRKGESPVSIICKYNQFLDQRMIEYLFGLQIDLGLRVTFPPLLCYAHRSWHNLAVFKSLIERGFDMNGQIEENGYTLLHVLLGKKNVQKSSVEFSLAKGVDPNKRDKNGCSCIFLLLDDKCCDAIPILRLVKKYSCDFSLVNNQGNNVLHEIGLKMNPSGVSAFPLLKYFVRNGVGLNVKNNKGILPIHYFFEKNMPLEFFKFLLQHVSEINTKTHGGETILSSYCVSQYCTLQRIQLLFNKGSELQNDQICVISRILNNKEVIDRHEVLQFFYQNGYNFRKKYENTETPLNFLLKDKNMNYKLFKFFINVGTDLNATDKKNRNPLYYAILDTSYRSNKILTKLLENGADPLIPQSPNLFVRLFSRTLPPLGIIKLFLKQGAIINSQDKYGSTALLKILLVSKELIDSITIWYDDMIDEWTCRRWSPGNSPIEKRIIIKKRFELDFNTGEKEYIREKEIIKREKEEVQKKKSKMAMETGGRGEKGRGRGRGRRSGGERGSGRGNGNVEESGRVMDRKGSEVGREKENKSKKDRDNQFLKIDNNKNEIKEEKKKKKAN